MAAQDQAISTIYFKKVLLEQTESEWRSCKEHAAATAHLISGCRILVKNEYLMRYDKVGAHVHCSLCKALGIETTDSWYKHTQTLTNQCVKKKILQCYGIITAYPQTEAAANRPDILIENKTKNKHVGRCCNTCRQKCHVTEAEKKLKHRSSCIEMQRMWCMKCIVQPVITRGIL
jgi:hypothetical protein